jgi:hypothetical protein
MNIFFHETNLLGKLVHYISPHEMSILAFRSWRFGSRFFSRCIRDKEELKTCLLAHMENGRLLHLVFRYSLLNSTQRIRERTCLAFPPPSSALIAILPYTTHGANNSFQPPVYPRFYSLVNSLSRSQLSIFLQQTRETSDFVFFDSICAFVLLEAMHAFRARGCGGGGIDCVGGDEGAAGTG